MSIFFHVGNNPTTVSSVSNFFVMRLGKLLEFFSFSNFVEFIKINDFYRPQRSCGKVMFSQASVILFTGGCVAEGRAWQERRPLQRAVRILLECILVQFC